MTRRFGDRAIFAVEVGESISSELRVVDLWAAGKWLTTDDNVAFLPSFLRFLRSSAAQVRRRDVQACPYLERTPEEIFGLLKADETEFREQFCFMTWGETVDNVSRYAWMDDDLVIVFAFRRPAHPFPEDLGRVFVARIPPDAFATTLEEAADLLDAKVT
ncbi:hypothetical protein [Micromonospora schwarzwaldensis]|uniref:hypothetical protein n=1 Tax=Micromonospora sp. DSM 45708 TaxID=3111767 RepID=UPI0031E3E101